MECFFELLVAADECFFVLELGALGLGVVDLVGDVALEPGEELVQVLLVVLQLMEVSDAGEGLLITTHKN